jgi:uncharacterized protein
LDEKHPQRKGQGVSQLFFDGKGKEYTPQVVKITVQRARELGIKYIVVASNTGGTAQAFLDEMGSDSGITLVVVTHHVGFHNPGEHEMQEQMRERLLGAGCRLLTTTHLFANIERAITSKFGGLYPGGIVSAALRCFGQGTKVCFEIASMAMDAGMIPPGVEVIVAGGSGRGADTALVMLPAHAKSFFETQVLEVLCKPRGV